MITKPFTKTEPDDPLQNAGWDAEKDMAFFLGREFGPRSDVFIFSDLRFADASGGFTQIDHLILYRHGIAIIESKSVSGELYVDKLEQWRRRWRSRSGRSGEENIPDPLAQAERQGTSLRRLLQSAQPPLLNKIVGLLQKRFGAFPIVPYVAISTNGRFSGRTAPFEGSVMKADQITNAINDQISHHVRNNGWRGSMRAEKGDITIFDLRDDELRRIVDFLMANDTPRTPPEAVAMRAVPPLPVPPVPPPLPPPAPRPAAARPANGPGPRVDRPEALTCAKCNSINVRVIFARNYCLKCSECGKFTPLAYTCPACGKPAAIRKDGPAYFRSCEQADGGGQQAVFWRDE